MDSPGPQREIIDSFYASRYLRDLIEVNMRGPADETVGEKFETDLLSQARDKTLEVILTVAAQVRPGMTELDAKALLKEIQTAKGAPKSWHPPQVRFGMNTTLGFGKPGQDNVTLQPNDIFFFDIGPIFEGHEGDVGRPFALGDDPEMKKCCHDAEEIWHEVRRHWREHKATGRDLYDFARACAQKRGWILNLENANGHRIADFPHAAKARGSIEGLEKSPAANRWILEIQIRHPQKPFGAFFEDLLN
jgi:methionyl aminopeptidase